MTRSHVDGVQRQPVIIVIHRWVVLQLAAEVLSRSGDGHVVVLWWVVRVIPTHVLVFIRLVVVFLFVDVGCGGGDVGRAVSRGSRGYLWDVVEGFRMLNPVTVIPLESWGSNETITTLVPLWHALGNLNINVKANVNISTNTSTSNRTECHYLCIKYNTNTPMTIRNLSKQFIEILKYDIPYIFSSLKNKHYWVKISDFRGPGACSYRALQRVNLTSKIFVKQKYFWMA